MTVSPRSLPGEGRRGVRNRGVVRVAAAAIAATAVSVAAAAAAAACPPVCLDVSQGSRRYGRFPPIATPTDVVEFYRYKHYSFNGDETVPLLVDQSLILIHYFEDPDDDDGDGGCDLSLVIVHDSKDDATGGQARLVVSGDHADPLVQDGPGDGSKSDMYAFDGGDGEGTTELFWEWGWQQGTSNKYRTDGMADSWLIGADSETEGCLTVSAKFIAGIVAWRFVPGPVVVDGGRTTGGWSAADPSDYLYLDMDETLSICKVPCGS